MSDEDLKAELERLRSENAALKKGASAAIRMKISEKGAVSIYGMGRFPVTLYKEQWLKLLDIRRLEPPRQICPPSRFAELRLTALAAGGIRRRVKAVQCRL